MVSFVLISSRLNHVVTPLWDQPYVQQIAVSRGVVGGCILC